MSFSPVQNTLERGFTKTYLDALGGSKLRFAEKIIKMNY